MRSSAGFSAIRLTRFRLTVFIIVLAANVYLTAEYFTKHRQRAVNSTNARHDVPIPTVAGEFPAVRSGEKTTEGSRTEQPAAEQMMTEPEKLAIPPALRMYYARFVAFATHTTPGGPPSLSEDIINLLQLDPMAVAKFNLASSNMVQAELDRNLKVIQVEQVNGAAEVSVGSVDKGSLLAIAAEFGNAASEVITEPEIRRRLVQSFLQYTRLRRDQLVPPGNYKVSVRDETVFLEPLETGVASANAKSEPIRLPQSNAIAAHIASRSRVVNPR